jgi:hypothetical protein
METAMNHLPTHRWASGAHSIQLLRTAVIVTGVTAACLHASPSPGQATPAEASDSAAAVKAASTVPRLIKYSGVLLDERGYPITLPVEVTFSLYDQVSPAQKSALWKETQQVSPNEKGQYTIYLGVGSSQGLPPEVFTSVSAQWLGVEVAGAGSATAESAPAKALAVTAATAKTTPATTVMSVGLTAPPQDFKVTGSPVTGSGTLALNWLTAPTSDDTSNAIVKRDYLGGFYAGIITSQALVDNGNLTVYGNSYMGPANLSGPVGIGTNSPAALLNINKNNQANADFLLLGNNTSRGLQMRDNGSGVDLESIGVPLNINFVTHFPTVINPNGGSVVVNDNKTFWLGPQNPALIVGSIVDAGGNAQSLLVEGQAGFESDVVIQGNLFVDGRKDFRIDHPLDPTQKYLLHASIESSEVLNQYSGNITTDELGQATVHFPDWFDVENTDFRYQLTVISGGFAQAIVANKEANNQFTIGTNAPHVEVSWLLTAKRNDPFMKAHPFVAEQEKPASKRGHYDHPELYGQPAEARQ